MHKHINLQVQACSKYVLHIFAHIPCSLFPSISLDCFSISTLLPTAVTVPENHFDPSLTRIVWLTECSFALTVLDSATTL